MTQLTKKDIGQLLDKRIDPLEKILRQTTAIVTHLVEDVRELKTEMRAVNKSLDDYTTTLDSIYQNTEASKIDSAAFKATP